SARPAVARTAVRRSVLLVAVDEVRNAVVDGDVVHLRDWQIDVEPRAATRRRDVYARVVADDHSLGIRRIDPHVVVVAAGRREPGSWWSASSSLGRRCGAAAPAPAAAAAPGRRER